MTRVLSMIALTAVWVVLWGQIDARSVVGGVVVAAALLTAFPAPERHRLDAFRPLALARFLVTYGWEIVGANAIVAWEVVSPGSRIREGIVAVPIVGASDAVVSTLAHVISGTPGTLIIDIERGEQTVLYVHVLHLHDVEQVRREVLELERRLVRAIGSSESLVAVEQRLARQGSPEADGPTGTSAPDRSEP